jgi:hypothetical protein
MRKLGSRQPGSHVLSRSHGTRRARVAIRVVGQPAAAANLPPAHDRAVDRLHAEQDAAVSEAPRYPEGDR